MSYDQNDDKLLKFFETEYEKGSLQFSIFSYHGGEPKLQINRMYKKKDGTVGYAKPGRLSYDEVLFLFNISEEILEIMKG